MQRRHQNYEFAKNAAKKYTSFDQNRTASFWELFDMLKGFVDLSDPDILLSNHQHLYQTAEGIRADGYPEWMQFVGLAHDLGKILHLRGGCIDVDPAHPNSTGCDDEGTSMSTQWAIVGDTYLTGCAIPETIVFPEFNNLNMDYSHPKYSTKQGIYTAGAGLKTAVPSFGHDEYLYHMFKASQIDIPEAGYYMIRYHSLYPWHKEGEYAWLEDEVDREMKPWVQNFNKYDLYTKSPETLDETEM